ncbi:MAG: hypothetical protein ACR2IF_17475 [Terriglobales bacterium]
MERAERLRLISRVCYYLGWIAGVVAIIVRVAQFSKVLERATSITARNLLEATLLLFLVCVASEIRALGLVSGGQPVGKGQSA